MGLFRVVESHDRIPHEYRIIEADDPRWLYKVAQEYRKLRTAFDLTIGDLELDGETFLSTDFLLQRVAEAAIPQRRGGNFDVIRSDFGEVSLTLHVEETYGCAYGYRSTRDRELAHLPGRGIDQIGVQSPIKDEVTGLEKMVLVLGEAKVSADKNSPPAVVDSSDDGLRAQHLFHIGNILGTADKVTQAARRCVDREIQRRLLLAAELLRARMFDRLVVICHSMMVRPHPFGQDTDFGSFASNPGDFSPGVVRFIIFRLPSGDLESIIDEFGQLARNGEDDPALRGPDDD